MIESSDLKRVKEALQQIEEDDPLHITKKISTNMKQYEKYTMKELKITEDIITTIRLSRYNIANTKDNIRSKIIKAYEQEDTQIAKIKKEVSNLLNIDEQNLKL